MTYLRTVDPGIRVLGWALWEDAVLVAAGLSRVPNAFQSLEACIRYHRTYLDVGPTALSRSTLCERMNARGKFSKVDPQDLIDVNLVAGALGTDWVLPAEWKGNLAEEKERERTLDRLTPSELRVVEQITPKYNPEAKKGLANHAISAIGIGLWFHGRGWMPARRRS